MSKLSSEPMGEWVRVKDKMPDQKEPIVYCRPNGPGRWHVGIAYWTVSARWNPEHESTSNPGGFTHWAPLPEPPDVSDRTFTSNPNDYATAIRLLHVIRAWSRTPSNEPNSARVDPLYPMRNGRGEIWKEIDGLLERHPYGEPLGLAPSAAGAFEPRVRNEPSGPAAVGAAPETCEQPWMAAADRLLEKIGHVSGIEPERKALLAFMPSQKASEPQLREWHFDRYRGGKLMAEGVVVRKKATSEEALEWARCQYPQGDVFVLVKSGDVDAP